MAKNSKGNESEILEINLLVRCRMGLWLQKMGWCSSLLKFEDSTIMSTQRLKYNISATGDLLNELP